MGEELFFLFLPSPPTTTVSLLLFHFLNVEGGRGPPSFPFLPFPPAPKKRGGVVEGGARGEGGMASPDMSDAPAPLSLRTQAVHRPLGETSSNRQEFLPNITLVLITFELEVVFFFLQENSYFGENRSRPHFLFPLLPFLLLRLWVAAAPVCLPSPSPTAWTGKKGERKEGKRRMNIIQDSQHASTSTSAFASSHQTKCSMFLLPKVLFYVGVRVLYNRM